MCEFRLEFKIYIYIKWKFHHGIKNKNKKWKFHHVLCLSQNLEGISFLQYLQLFPYTSKKGGYKFS